ncbi:MAG: hypothetical protein J6P38_06415 [Acetobacter sp.]|nr:hypothetical protein [Acetobacter sp.]
MKKTPKNTPKYTHKILLLSLAISLSGCAGWGRWNDNWNNITGGVRDYGQYPMPNAQTCFTNPTLVAAKQQGLYNLESQKVTEGISPITLVRDELIPATNQLFVNNNPQPLNALYAQIQPQGLANFMIGCNEVVVQERQQIIQGRQRIIQHINTQRNQIAQWQNYLNTTPAPQPTLQTFQLSYTKHHPEIEKAGNTVANIYEANPVLLFLTLCLYTPVDQIDTFLNIRTLQGLQNFKQQLQQRHLMPNPIPTNPPPMNWAKYKLTFTKIQNLKITTAQTIQGLQQIHQQLQQIHQAFDGSRPGTMRVESTATICSPSADLKFWESLPYHGTPGSLGIISYDKALIAAHNRNWLPFVAIAQQMQPQTWRNYFVNLYTWGQKTHQKEIVHCD